MKQTHIGLMLVVLTLTATSGWTEAEPESRERFVCNFGANQRFIDIYRLAASGPRGGGCRVDYTRDGVTKPALVGQRRLCLLCEASPGAGDHALQRKFLLQS